MLVDELRIRVRAGRGGDGCLSFRRERFVPRGGPDGGPGGRGGSVLLRADRNVGTLLALRRAHEYAAANGQPGRGRNRTGAAGDDLVVPVPVGTVVRDAHTGAVLADLTADGQEAVVACGGRGGRGNKAFATPTHQTPREFEHGEPGEARDLDLELKLIADVGLVGLPNAGKSTLLARLSAARPRIASYPFTTLEPQLGLVAADDYRSFVLADIPGLIAGAHAGAGLGHKFLRHIERTACLAHIVDLAPADGSDPVRNLAVVREELARFSEALSRRPQVVVGNKLDLPGAQEAADRLEQNVQAPLVCVSAATGQGMDALVAALLRMLDACASSRPEA